MPKFRLPALMATIYILLAFVWWSILLLRKDSALQLAEIQLLRHYHIEQGIYKDEAQFITSPAYQQLSWQHDRQFYMILGEGFVMLIGLIWGIWVVQRSFQRQVEFVRQRRNFLLAITHELKSPIASIRLVLQTFQKRQLAPEQQAKVLHSGMVETDRLNDLVNNLLLSSRLDTAYEPHLEALDMAILIEDIIEKFQLKFPKADIQYEKNEMPLYYGDKQGLTSVFTNLIENALKYAKNSPIIRISHYVQEGKCVFEIADNGIGIAPQERRKVFEKFYRAGNEETRQTKGTGLGLYIVAEIVKLHNGQITILDNPPRGTVFKICLPIAAKRRSTEGLSLESFFSQK